MKQLFFLLISLLGCGLIGKSQSASLEATDMKNFQGLWKGALTYLDYSNGKPYTMPAQKAILRKTYTVSETVLRIRKDVQFEGTTQWIKRHEYVYSK